MRIAFIFLLALWPTLSLAQNTVVDVRGVTPTQAVIHVRVKNADGTPYVGNCTYRVSEGQSFAALVNDINPALFAGSNSDARQGSIINGDDHFFVVGTRTAAQALDGRHYSRALQAATTHWVGVTCGNAPEVSTIFTTENPPLGNSFPEAPAFDAASFGNHAAPTIDFSDDTKTYIDPLTGLLVKRITGPADYIDENIQHSTFSYVRDVLGNGWSNAQNAISNQSPSTLAATSTPNAGLFLSWNTLDTTNNFDIHSTPNDVMLRAYCSAQNGGQLQACISLDSGKSCATDTVTIACPAQLGEVDVPGNYPSPVFKGWGVQHQPLTKAMLSNQPAPGVWVSGNQVNWYSGYSQFYAERAAGSKVMIQGTSPGCSNNVCTVASVNSPTSMTLQENVGTDVGGSTLTAAVRAGATTLTFKGVGNLLPGNHIQLDQGASGQETVQVATNYVAGSTTVPLQSAVANAHAVGAIGYWAGLDSSNNAVTLQDYGPGILTWLANTGGSPSVSASFTFDRSTSEQFINTTNAELDACSSLPVTDISTDKYGNPISPPLTGYLCSFVGQDLVLWIPSTGEKRLLSTYWQQGIGRMAVPLEAFSNSDPKTLFATNVGTLHFYKAVYTNPPGVYIEYNPGPGLPPAPDLLVWTDLTATSAPIDQQLASYGGPAQAAYATGLFPPLKFVGTVGGYAIYDTSTGSDSPCIKVRTLADTNQIVQAFDSWDTPPLRWGGCHSAPAGTGSYLNLTVNPDQHFNNTATLGGPYTLNITQMRRGGVWTTYSQAITAATNSSPVTFTAVNSALDEYLNATFGTGPGKGPQITVSGGTGAWAAVNGTWNATIPFGDPSHFSIPVDTTSFGPVTGNLSFSAAPPLIHSQVAGITQTTPAVVTTQNSIADEPLNHRFQDGDAIGFGNLSQTQQYYAKVSGYSNNTFAVYQDQALTQPVNGAGLTAATSGMVYYAETCPSGLPASFTTNMTFDNVGATGVRCITVRVDGEPCSAFATAAEHAQFPCKKDPSNSSKAGLTNLQPGDALRDIARGIYDETFVIVQETKNSENDIVLTLMRWYGIQAQGDNHTTNPSSNSHDVGWTPFMVPSNSHASGTGWIDAKDPTNTFISANPIYAFAHGDFGHGNGAGLVTYAAGYPDDISDVTLPNLLAAPVTFTKNEQPSWANSAGTQLSYNYDQSYPGHRQLGAPASEMVWKGDWFAMNSAFGSGQGSGSGLLGGMTLTNIAGTSYDPSSSTSHVYKISNAAGAFDRKRTPTYAWAGKWMFQDMSAPGSLITDANLWSYCVADNAGECRPGSAKNDVFLSGSDFYFMTNGWCLTNILNVSTPCFTGANPLAGWALQLGMNPVDTTGRRIRRLTLGFAAPGMHWTFTNWFQSPGGQWGFFSVPFVNGLRNDYFAIKLPPWPSLETVNRNTFINVPVQVGAFNGSTYARARFGYAENSNPANLYCTSRGETCSTDIPAASPSDPYSFLGESPNRLNCASGCTITIPAVPGRVLYYIVDRLDSNGNVVGSSPLQALAVP